MSRLREDPEPTPRRARPRILSIQCVGHEDTAAPRGAARGPHDPGTRELLLQTGYQTLRQHHNAVLAAFAIAHDDRLVFEVQVLDPKLQALGDAQARAVQQLP